MFYCFLGYFVVIVVIIASVDAQRQTLATSRAAVARLAFVPVLLVIAQVILGLVTVVSGRIVAVVTMHTAIGGLLLATLAALYYGFGPLGAARAGSPLTPEATA